ncbi:MAG: GIY-YIG nuclease family protein, partial [Bacteroidetes bacterium]|nr:GIY-YIG nuclease family protein [Bacteroidota bacterium]
MNSCYVIFSKKLDRFYIGACHDSLEERLKKHNNHSYGVQRFTAKANDWVLFLEIECDSFSQALKIEKHIKSMKSSTYIKNLVRFPEMVTNLKLKFQSVET